MAALHRRVTASPNPPSAARRPGVPMKKQQTATLASICAEALATAQHGGRIAIALSGGLDSSALLHLAHAHAKEQGIALYAFHVHHGISPNADTWLAHCEQQCAALGATFEARRITLENVRRSGTEAAARKARYAALGAIKDDQSNVLFDFTSQITLGSTSVVTLIVVPRSSGSYPNISALQEQGGNALLANSLVS
eukprot:gene34472-42513_t